MANFEGKRTEPQFSLAEVAREEFIVMAKAFFAPIYGTWLVLSELMKR